MKKITFHRKWQMLCLIFIILSNTSKAQFNVYPAANFEAPVYSLFPNITNINNAVFTNSNGTVWGVTFDDGSFNTYGNPLRFEVTDNVNTTLAWAVTGPSGNYYITHPDMIFGGDCNNNYVALVYSAEETTTHAKDVYLEVYTLTNVGSLSPVMGITNCSTYIFKLSTSGDADSAHIDLINEVGVCGTAPKGNRFVMSWQDAACQANTGMYGVKYAHGNFSFLVPCSLNNARGVNVIGCVNPNTRDASSSDVAAYSRSGTNYFGQFVYTDPATGYLYGRNVNILTWVLGTEQLLDNTPGNPGEISNPRVEVTEKFVTPDVEVVYRWYNPGTGIVDIKSWNNTATQDISLPYSPGLADYDNYSPVVASGPGQYFSAAYASPGTWDSLYVNLVDWTTGQMTTTTGDPDYYTVNRYGGIGSVVAISNDWQMVSSIQEPLNTYVCWYNPNISGGSIECKTTQSNPPAYKSAQSTAIGKNQKVELVKTYPNPATDKLFINTGNKQGDNYLITDMTGRIILQGNMNGNVTQEINVNNLATGFYVITIVNTDKTVNKVKFMKK